MKPLDTSLSAIHQYLNQQSELLTPKQEKELTKAYQETHDVKIKNELIEHNTRLVIAIAKQYYKSRSDLSFDDIIQEGNLGLMKAIDHYDYTKGFKLSTYATFWIHQSIRRGLADKGALIRIPVHLVTDMNRMNTLMYHLEMDLGREPLLSELKAELEMPIDKIKQMIKLSRGNVSLDYTMANSDGEDGDATLQNYLADKSNTEAELMHQSLCEELDQGLKSLDPREALVLKARYGLLDGRLYTLDETADLLYDCGYKNKKSNGRISRERVRQLQVKAIYKIRPYANSHKLERYITD